MDACRCAQLQTEQIPVYLDRPQSNQGLLLTRPVVTVAGRRTRRCRCRRPCHCLISCKCSSLSRALPSTTRGWPGSPSWRPRRCRCWSCARQRSSARSAAASSWMQTAAGTAEFPFCKRYDASFACTPAGFACVRIQARPWLFVMCRACRAVGAWSGLFPSLTPTLPH
jgi:hypothetical protein